MNYLLYSFIAGLVTWGLTIIGSFAVYGLNSKHKVFLALLLGFGGGVMVSASFFSLILPAIEFCEELHYLTWFVCLIGFTVGIVIILIIDNSIKIKNDENIKKSSKLLVLAVIIHNIPEGLAIGVAFGSVWQNIEGATLTSAIMLAIGIGLQNLPEGAAISIPLRVEGMNKHKACLIGSLSAIVEPVAAVFGTLLAMSVQQTLPFILILAAAIMIFVVIDELLIEGQTYHKRMTSIGFCIGFTVMMILDLAFK